MVCPPENICTLQYTDGSAVLFIDALFDFLSLKINNIPVSSIQTLSEFLDDEEYDTDSIKIDIEQLLNSNISQIIKNKLLLQKLENFVATSKGLIYCIECI